MQARKAIIAVVLIGLIGTWPAAPRHVHAQEIPVTYVCTMDPDVIDDKPGTCPVCKMVLQPVRIESGYSCPNHAVIVRAQPGTCPIDKRELLPVFINHYWDCGEIPEKLYADPGKCGNGKPREEFRRVRAHGDHNPRHGGQFFMGTDKWHHVEGTYPSSNLLRLYVFDNFTQPLDLKSFNCADGKCGRAFTREDGNRELDAVLLRPSKDGKTLEATIKGTGFPQKVSVRVRFKKETPEDKFDFIFAELSKEPPAGAPTTGAKLPPPAPRMTTAATPAPAKPAPATVPAAVPAPPPAPIPAPVAEAPRERPAVIGATPDPAASALTLTRADATSLAQDLPTSSAELLKLLDLRAKEVESLIQEGNFGMVYVPTMLAKEVALALQDRATELPARQHIPLTAAVRQLILASWRLDQYGDLGDREKITQAHSVFVAATNGIKAAYAAGQR